METLDYSLPLEANHKNIRSVELVSADEANNQVVVTLHYVDGSSRNHAANYKTGIVGSHNTDSPVRLRNCSSEQTAITFYIAFGREEWDKDQWKPVDWDRYSYDNGKKAAAQAKKMNEAARDTATSFRFRVSREIRNAAATDWRGWMERRFHTGEYVLPVWKDEDWFKGKTLEHFAHPSRKDGTKIAFVASEEDGLADKLTIMSPGRYLTQYYSDVLDEEERAKWATKFDVDCELKFATTGDEIGEIYQSGISSCMSYRPGHFHPEMTEHPTAVYAAGDLALAYLVKNGRPIARALTWPEKKVWMRIYGDSRRLQGQLETLGYRAGRALDFEDARILRKPSPHGGDYVIMPYLDLSLHARMDSKDDTILRISRYGNICGNNHSTAASSAHNRSTIECGNCGRTIEPDAGHYYPQFSRVCCASCSGPTDLNGWQCTFSGDWFTTNNHRYTPLEVLNPLTGEPAGVVASSYLPYHPEVVQVGDLYYLREGLAWDSTNEQWTVPSPVTEQKAA